MVAKWFTLVFLENSRPKLKIQRKGKACSVVQDDEGVEGAGHAQQGTALEREQSSLPAGLRRPRHPGVRQELPDRVPGQAGQFRS